jgi:hypothetical protein
MDGTCPQCGRWGLFGYRSKQSGELIWYCADHRLGQYYADARRDISPKEESPAPLSDTPPPADPFVHPCQVCGEHAYFGFNVGPRQDRIGQWFCALHRPC